MSEDQIIKTTKEFVEKLILDKLGFEGEAGLEFKPEDDKNVLHVSIDGEDLSLLIGRGGRNLDSIQHLIIQFLYKTAGEHVWVRFDINSYRERKVKRLEDLALKAAQQTIDYGVETSLDPMNPAERRIVHMALADEERIVTESEGEGFDRHIVIKPKGGELF